MTYAINSEGRGGVFVVDITGANNTDNAGLASVPNPEGADVLILRTTWRVITHSTGAANVGIGITTAAAKATDILNDLAAGGAIDNKVYNGHAMQNTAKTEITAPAIWEAAKYLTVTGSADTSGLSARLYVEYIRL